MLKYIIICLLFNNSTAWQYSKRNVPKKKTVVLCQTFDSTPDLLRTDELVCTNHTEILIESALLTISTADTCPHHYINGQIQPSCNEIIKKDVKLYLATICEHKRECYFSFKKDLPSIRCLNKNNKIKDIDPHFSSMLVTYSCRITRIPYWPFRRKLVKRRRVNLKRFFPLKKLKEKGITSIDEFENYS